MRARLLGVAVGLALADSSIVTLALPEILGQFDVAITSVAWVLTSFNLVLAVVAVPAAYVSRRRPREAFVAGVVRLRRGVAGVRARALVRGARRRAVRPGARRRAARHGGTRSPLTCGGERRGGAAHLGRSGRARRRARPCRRRNPHAAARLGVDLPRAGAARAGVAARGARSGRSARAGSRRETVDHAQTPRCSSSRAASSRRSSSSCSSSSTGGGCHRPRPASS